MALCSRPKHLTPKLLQHGTWKRIILYFLQWPPGYMPGLSVQWWSWVPLIPASKQPYQISLLCSTTLLISVEFNLRRSEWPDTKTDAFTTARSLRFKLHGSFRPITFSRKSFLSDKQKKKSHSLNKVLLLGMPFYKTDLPGEIFFFSVTLTSEIEWHFDWNIMLSLGTRYTQDWRTRQILKENRSL